MNAQTIPTGIDTEFTPAAPLQTAVLFIIFNRPDVTARVFEAIRKARPPRLYIAADGPRSNRPGEAEKCQRTRQLVERIDWPCEVQMLLRNQNLGCRRAVSSAIDWFFEHETQGIILEDDCLPVQSFFWYCEEMLNRYQHDERIGQISGSAFCEHEFLAGLTTDYIFSRHFSIWGWATWRRVWETNASAIELWPEFSRQRLLPGTYPDRNERYTRSKNNDSIATNAIDAWSFQWIFANVSQNRLAVVPRHNLIINIGFGEEATHTTFRNPIVPTSASELPLPTRPARFVHADHVYDHSLSRRLYRGRLRSKFDSLMNRLRDPVFMRLKLCKLLHLRPPPPKPLTTGTIS